MASSTNSVVSASSPAVFSGYAFGSFERPPKHPALRLIDYLTLNVVIEMLVYDGDRNKVMKIYEMLGIVSALIAGCAAQFVMLLPSSLPTPASDATASTSSGLGTWLVVSALGSVGLAIMNILCCSMTIVAVHACPNYLEMLHDIPLAGFPILILFVNIMFLLIYLAAYMYTFLPTFAPAIIAWFGVCFAIFLGITFYIFGYYLPSKIRDHQQVKENTN